MMMPKRQNLCMLLIVCLLVLVVVNLVVTIRFAADTRAWATRTLRQPALACAAIPMRFVMDEPECADKLFRAMNVTNVHVLSPNGSTWIK
jgi:hypothetical protein